MSSNTPPPGEVRLFDRVEPALRQGIYQVDLGHTLPPLPELNSADRFLSNSRYIEIVGRRWSIDPLTIHQRLPPKNEQGVLLDSSIPKIVFQSKTLPWERVADENDDNVPWMALLLLREDEIEEYCSLHLVEKGDGVLVSSIINNSSDPDADLRVNALQIPEKLLEAIAPLRDEIPLLAHALEVNPLDKELCGSDEDGWFSVILSNRIPTEPNTKYFACLVSLDDGIINEFPNPPGEPNYVVPIDYPDHPQVDDYSTSSTESVPNDDDFLLKVEDIPLDGPIPEFDIDPNGPLGPKVQHVEFDGPVELDKVVDRIGEGNENSGGQNGFNPLDLLLALPKFPFFSKKVSDSKASNKQSNSSQKEESKGEILKTSIKISDIDDLKEELSIVSQIKAPDFTSNPVLLPLLHHWTFRTGDGGDFESRMRNLRVRSREEGIDSVGDLGSLADMMGRDGSDYEPALLGNDMDPDVSVNSYLMTDIVCDDGITRPCLYRGPCIAVQLDHERKDKPYTNSDQALGIEVSTGIEEISHSAAFELGRLLALSDPNFISSVSKWRRIRYRLKAILDNQAVLVEKFPIISEQAIKSEAIFETKLVEMAMKEKIALIDELENIVELKREVCGTGSPEIDLDNRFQPDTLGPGSVVNETEMIDRYNDFVHVIDRIEYEGPERGGF